MRTSNPTLKDRVFTGERALPHEGVMTLEGTATKSLILIVLTIFSATFTWREFFRGNTEIMGPALLIGGLGGFLVAMIASFKPRTAPITGPLYAVLEGLFLGAISAMYQARYAGLPMQAVALTTLTFVALLVLYRTGIIRATDKLRAGIIAATMGIMLFYLASMLLGFFGVRMPLIHSNGPLGIAFSLVVVGVAALNLVLDFDFIEKGVAHRAPKHLEWYGAFGLLVTLVWLYVEMLRLLGKLRR
jgi:uncharacterized YccA/Bax inhibitor family protein